MSVVGSCEALYSSCSGVFLPLITVQTRVQTRVVTLKLFMRPQRADSLAVEMLTSTDFTTRLKTGNVKKLPEIRMKWERDYIGGVVTQADSDCNAFFP